MVDQLNHLHFLLVQDPPGLRITQLDIARSIRTSARHRKSTREAKHDDLKATIQTRIATILFAFGPPDKQ